MTASPPSTIPTSPQAEDKAKRNVACINCRNSKVRCKPSPVPGESCQRCAKLQLTCIVDKSHKRVTKRSKLELLEQELETIKQAVSIPTKEAVTTHTPPSPRKKLPFSNFPVPTSTIPTLPAVLQTPTTVVQTHTPLSDTPGLAGPRSQLLDIPVRTEPTEPRMLGEHLVTGEDIDWYFAKFLHCFHPFLPILRKRVPNDCYQSCPILFWVIIYITCRRYTKDRIFFTKLASHVNREIWMLLSNPVMNLEAIHALLYLACWPLPSIRLVTDPSTTLVSIAMTNAMMIGLHTGRGSHREFCIGLRKYCESTNEEASSTWLACCMLAQKIAAYSGHPPPSIRLDDGSCLTNLDNPFWTDLIVMFRMQKFMNRFHTAMAAHVSSCGGVSHTIVSMWESELEIVKPVFAEHPTELSVFLELAALLEMQVFYFNPDNVIDNPPAPINIFKAFHTARNLIATALEQESRSKFLTHAAHWVFRLVVDAACIIIAVLHSPTCPDIGANDAAVLAQQAIAAIHRCSVQENDLPHRAGVIIETFWTYHVSLPKLELGDCTWSSRLSIGFTCWCLDKFKVGLQAAQRSNDAAVQKDQPILSYDKSTTATVPTATDPAMPSDVDLMEIDWNMFMEEFGWVNEKGVLLGLP